MYVSANLSACHRQLAYVARRRSVLFAMGGDLIGNATFIANYTGKMRTKRVPRKPFHCQSSVIKIYSILMRFYGLTLQRVPGKMFQGNKK